MSDREKLIERLREMASHTPPVCQYDRPNEVEILGKQITVYCKPFEQFQDLMREAADAIVNGVTVQKWIPVSERLPTEEDANINGSVLAIDIHDGFSSCWAWESVKTFPESFTHWMPLPEPPKECD